MQQQYPPQGTPQASTGLPQVKGPEMNDRDRLNDVLSTVKNLTVGYNIGTNEASNDRLYQTQMNILTNLHNCQRDLFNMMHSKGWYKTEPVAMQQVTTTFQQFSNYSTQFPY